MPESAPRHAVTSPRLFDGDQWLLDHGVVIDGGAIHAVVPSAGIPADIPRFDCPEGFLCPGFIDLQVNGGGGVLFNNDPSPAGLQAMVAAHRKLGTTALLPTLISDTPEQEQHALAAVREYRQSGNRGVLGLHLEGPFFNAERRGTHAAAMIRAMNEADINRLTAAGDIPLVVTLAPDAVSAAHIKALADAGIRVCAGHSDAGFSQVQQALQAGLCGFTHLFNAMSQISGREPGMVGAALNADDAWAGIIVDGHHVDAANVRLAARAKPAGKLFLVSDAMSPVGSRQASMDLYGESVSLREGRLVNSEGKLAGSAIALADAVRICHQQVGLPLEECLRMAATYPAGFLGIDNQLGRIECGYRADLVHIDPGFTATSTWVNGLHQPSGPV